MLCLCQIRPRTEDASVPVQCSSFGSSEHGKYSIQSSCIQKTLLCEWNQFNAAPLPVTPKGEGLQNSQLRNSPSNEDLSNSGWSLINLDARGKK